MELNSELTRSRWPRVLSAVMALTIVLGCTAGASFARGTADRQSVKIVIQGPLSGAGAFAAPIALAAKAYLDYSNDKGLVPGYQFDV